MAITLDQYPRRYREEARIALGRYHGRHKRIRKENPLPRHCLCCGDEIKDNLFFGKFVGGPPWICNGCLEPSEEADIEIEISRCGRKRGVVQWVPLS